MASSSGYDGAEGAAQSISRKLHATDLPSKCLLGKGLASIVYESEWKGLRCARKDFIGVRSDIFEAEAGVLVHLEHDNIVKTHGWTIDKMSCSLVVEYVEDDLLGLLQHRKKSQSSPAGTGLELREALQVMLQTATAMEYLHGQGIIHGDLKTNNILVTQVNGGGKNSLLVKVADFGLTQTKRKSIPFVSRPVRKLDMVQWKAPEYFKRPLSDASEDNDESSESDSSSNKVCTSGSLDLNNDRLRFQACDTYSFAVTCYHILTGKKPYPNWNWKALGAKIVHDNLRPKLPTSCPIMLRDLLVQCWDEDPMNRPTFTDICNALEEIQLTILEAIYHPNPTTGVLDNLSTEGIANQTPTIDAAILSKNFNLEIKDESHDGHEMNTSMKSLMEINVGHEEQNYEVNSLSHWSIESSKRHWSRLSSLNFNPKKEKVEANKSWSLHHFLSQLFCFGTSSSRGHMDKIKAEANIREHILQGSFPQLRDFECSKLEEQELLIDNEEAFRTLQLHPNWGQFFQTFDYDSAWPMSGKLEVGEKFAENAQVEFFHTKVTWQNQEMNKDDREEGREWMLKVFKMGTLLRYLQFQIPLGMLQFYADQVNARNSQIPTEFPRYISMPHCGTLLKDGRFAFLMRSEPSDLRSIIDHNMETRSGINCGPFSKEDVEEIMWNIALGVDWLHQHNIIHRDLKASNVLVEVHHDRILQCFIADYECSVGVIGTGFFRAPEILQACKDKSVNHRPEVFSTASDVYSYGMTCYEVLTGKIPFEDLAYREYDRVLTGHRPLVPKYVDDWIYELLQRCWLSEPMSRPTFGEILRIISTNSMKVRKLEEVSINRK